MEGSGDWEGAKGTRKRRKDDALVLGTGQGQHPGKLPSRTGLDGDASGTDGHATLSSHLRPRLPLAVPLPSPNPPPLPLPLPGEHPSAVNSASPAQPSRPDLSSRLALVLENIQSKNQAEWGPLGVFDPLLAKGSGKWPSNLPVSDARQERESHGSASEGTKGKGCKGRTEGGPTSAGPWELEGREVKGNEGRGPRGAGWCAGGSIRETNVEERADMGREMMGGDNKERVSKRDEHGMGEASAGNASHKEQVFSMPGASHRHAMPGVWDGIGGCSQARATDASWPGCDWPEPGRLLPQDGVKPKPLWDPSKQAQCPVYWEGPQLVSSGRGAGGHGQPALSLKPKAAAFEPFWQFNSGCSEGGHDLAEATWARPRVPLEALGRTDSLVSKVEARKAVLQEEASKELPSRRRARRKPEQATSLAVSVRRSKGHFGHSQTSLHFTAQQAGPRLSNTAASPVTLSGAGQGSLGVTSVAGLSNNSLVKGGSMGVVAVRGLMLEAQLSGIESFLPSSIGVPQALATTMKAMILQYWKSLQACEHEKADALRVAILTASSPAGSAEQRIGSFFFSAIQCRQSEDPPPRSLLPPECRPKDPKTAIAQHIAVDVLLPFCYTTAFHSIRRAMRPLQQYIHLIIFGISSSQFHRHWSVLIHVLATRPQGPPRRLRITGIKSFFWEAKQYVPNSARDAASNAEHELAAAARAVGIPEFEYREVSVGLWGCEDLESVEGRRRASMEGTGLGVAAEFVAVCSAFHFLVVPEETAGDFNFRQQLLEWMCQLQPDVFTFMETDCDALALCPLTRLASLLDYFSALFDSHDITNAKTFAETLFFEDQFHRQLLVNAVSEEGLQRVARMETADMWVRRLRAAGFVTASLDGVIIDQMRNFVRSHASEYGVVVEPNLVRLCWKGWPLVFCSVWKTLR